MILEWNNLEKQRNASLKQVKTRLRSQRGLGGKPILRNIPRLELWWQTIHLYLHDWLCTSWLKEVLAQTTKKSATYTIWSSTTRTYGLESQKTLPQDTSKPLDKHRKKKIERIVGKFLYNGYAVDVTILNAPRNIELQQSTVIVNTKQRCDILLDYLHTNPNMVVHFYASDMILNVHSEASYLSTPKARRRVGEHYFLGSLSQDNKPMKVNGPIYALCEIIRLITASAAEAELAALFLNAKETKIMCLRLEEMGSLTPKTPIHHINNTTVVGIVNNTIKWQCSRAIEMCYFWLLDQENQNEFKFKHWPGTENMGDYHTKVFSAKDMKRQRGMYIHAKDSPRFLMRIQLPYAWQGCVKFTWD